MTKTEREEAEAEARDILIDVRDGMEDLLNQAREATKMLEECGMFYDNKDAYIFEQIGECIYNANPYNQSINSLIEEIENGSYRDGDDEDDDDEIECEECDIDLIKLGRKYSCPCCGTEYNM